MSGVMPKVGIYIFLSIICLLINISVFMTVVIANDSANINEFTQSQNYDLTPNRQDNATIGDFAIVSGTSFIPFVSLVSLTLIGDIPFEVTVITTFVIGIIGALQVFLIGIIILNLVPKFLGSGFDV